MSSPNPMIIPKRILFQIGLVIIDAALVVYIADLVLTDRQIDISGKVITAAATLVAAGIAGMIAWRQWKTADAQRHIAGEKLRLDLFGVRMEVITALLNKADELAIDGIQSADDVIFIGDLATKCEFLFGKSAANFVHAFASQVSAAERRGKADPNTGKLMLTLSDPLVYYAANDFRSEVVAVFGRFVSFESVSLVP